MKNYSYCKSFGVRNIFFIFLFLTIYAPSSCFANKLVEIKAEEAILVAKEEAKKDKYDYLLADVEILKVAKKRRGPIRFGWLLRHFSGKDIEYLLNKEFWIVYFYPKGFFESPGVLGGGYCAIVELYSGDLLLTFSSK